MNRLLKILKVNTKQRKTGDIGENLAAKYLRKKGYKILERNYIACGYEVDIIAESKNTYSFVEVKTRTVSGDPLYESRPSQSVTPEKQRKIISCAKYYNVSDRGKMLSLDIIEVYLYKDGRKPKIIHMENAFNINTSKEKQKHI